MYPILEPVLIQGDFRTIYPNMRLKQNENGRAKAKKKKKKNCCVMLGLDLHDNIPEFPELHPIGSDAGGECQEVSSGPSSSSI